MAKKPSEDPKGIVTHRAFKEAIREARLPSFRKDPRTRVRTESEFEAMKAHVLKLYEGVEVASSFTDAAGQVFDCIPVAEQPSARASGAPIASPPSLAGMIGGANAPADEPQSPEPPAELDRHGNEMRCPPGFVPMRRVTLDELTRFATLDDFFRKSGPLNPTAPAADTSQNHRYAYAHQEIDNFGGHSFLNLRAPSVTGDQIFSLSQHWYAAGTGAGHQTVEVGWQVYPGKYGHSQPVLFIYWTSDNYGPSGAYNLDKAGFVQTNPAWTIGGALSPVGTPDGQQYEIEVAFYLNGGNWWLYLGGLQVQNAVGYYPGSLFGAGAMASNATQALYGGETICGAAGPWPEMGSGAFAGAIWPHAAWHRAVFVLPKTGGAQWATLKGESPSPACYDQNLGGYQAPWNVTLFFGGPGGSNC
ncbi:MAG: neprosin family prolyl endopeptidase [Sphingomicrobium sp.]